MYIILYKCALKINKKFLKIVMIIAQKTPKLIKMHSKSLIVFNYLMYVYEGILYLKSWKVLSGNSQKIMHFALK